ncbi:MAG: hypothetical protein H6747_15035 [Deltaproteobacteria bacterium]|nr:hypothetical protein [Deltaproteobacteria bacterium]
MAHHASEVSASLKAFRDAGDTAALSALVAGFGPALASWLHRLGVEDSRDAFDRAWAKVATGTARANDRTLLACLLGEIAPRPGHLAEDAAWLAATLGLSADDIAYVLRTPSEEVRSALIAGYAERLGPASRTAAHHLEREQLVALGLGLLQGAALADATSHINWCSSCRGRVEAAIGTVAREPLVEVGEAAVQRAVAAASELRAARRVGPRVARFWGLRPGAPWRPARLAAIGLVLALGVVAAAAWIRSDRIDETFVTATLAVRAPALLVQGGTAIVKVSATGRDADGKVAGVRAGVPVTVRLEAGGEPVGEGVTAPTDASGEAVLALPVPIREDGGSSLEVVARATIDEQLRTASAGTTIARRFRQHLSVDKPTYQPGQTVHLRGLSFDGGSQRPLVGRPAELLVHDPSGNKLTRIMAEVSEHGVCAGDFELSPRAALGTYKATLTVDDHRSEVAFEVEQYALPPFSVAVTPAVRSTEGNAPFEVRVVARLTTGSPLAKGTVRLQAHSYGRQLFSKAAQLEDGAATFTIPLSEKNSVDHAGAISLTASVRDVAGRAEKGSASVLVARDELYVALRSAAPSLRRTLPRPNKILVRVTRPGDIPAEVPVRLYAPDEGSIGVAGSGERLGEAKTGPDGLAEIDLPPAYFGRPLAVLATDPDHDKTYWQHVPAPPVRAGALVLGCDRALLRAGATLRCEVFAPEEDPLEITASVGERIVGLAATPAGAGIHTVALELPEDAAGLVRVEVIGAHSADAVHAIISPKDGLRVAFDPLPARKPGQEAKVGLKLTDGEGKPRVGAVGLSVVDAAVFARVAGETPMQVIRALLGSESAAEVAALMYPEAEPGSDGGLGNWTPAQQAGARWLLATQSSTAPQVRRHDSLSSDRHELQERKWAAGKLANQAKTVAQGALLALLFAALLLWSRWLRAGVGAASVGLGVLALLQFGLLLLTGRRTANTGAGTLAMGLGLLAFGAMLWLAWREFRRRRLGQEPARLWIWGRRLAVVSAVGLLAVATTGKLGRLLEGRDGSWGYDSGRMYAESAPHNTYEMMVEEKATEPEPEDMPAPRGAAKSAPSGYEAERKKQVVQAVRSKTIPGALLKGGSASKLFGDAGDDATGLRLAGAGGGGGEEEATTALRQDFPETLYHNPAIVTDAEGRAEVAFRVADSITTWRALALASDAAGALGAGDASLVVDKDFTVDLDVPRNLTVGDDVNIQVAAHNQTDADSAVTLQCTVGAGLKVDATPLGKIERIAAHSDAGALLPLHAVAAGTQAVRLDGALGSGDRKDTDALQRTIEVVPNGREVFRTVAGTIDTSFERSFDLPAHAMPDARNITLTLLGSPLAAALDALDQLAEMPRGCFEQTASKAFADAVILQALRTSKRLGEGQELALKRMVRIGYQDMLGFQQGGGFTYFSDEPRIHLTAFGLMTLAEIARVAYVDEEVMQRAQRWLVGRQESFGGFGGPAQTAYVALAMRSAYPDCLEELDPNADLPGDVRQRHALCRKLFGAVSTTFAISKGVDSYPLALAADALVEAGPTYRAQAEKLLDALQARSTVVGSGKARRVAYGSETSTLCGGYGRAAETETTALIAHALIRHGGRAEQARDALRSLLALRDARGGFQSTQGTVFAMRAILAAAETAKGGGKAIVSIDGEDVATIALDPLQSASPQPVELTAKVDAGSRLSVRLVDRDDAATDVGYRLTSRWYEPWESPPGPDLAPSANAPTLQLRQRMDQARYGLGDTASLRVEVERSVTGAPRGMVVAQVGIPPGFQVGSLASLRASAPEIRRVEPSARGLAIYFYDPPPGRTFSFAVPLTAARAVRRVSVPRSRAYYYYEPQIEAQAAPVPITVIPRIGNDLAP